MIPISATQSEIDAARHLGHTFPVQLLIPAGMAYPLTFAKKMSPLRDWSDLPLSTKAATKKATAAAVEVLKDLSSDDISLVSIIVNHFEAPRSISMELWVSLRSTVEKAIALGVSEKEARWLYEHWSSEDPAREIFADDYCPETGIEGYFSAGCEIARGIRQAMPEFQGQAIIVDDNHEYDGLVMKAVAKANPDGQAHDWLIAPPPDCVPSNLNSYLLERS